MSQLQHILIAEFAFEKSDYTVCENISNPFLKQSCDQLKKVAELQAMQEANE